MERNPKKVKNYEYYIQKLEAVKDEIYFLQDKEERYTWHVNNLEEEYNRRTGRQVLYVPPELLNKIVYGAKKTP